MVGAGISKLVATKCLEEGLEPTCFEQRQGIVGLWCYTVVVSETNGKEDLASFDAVMAGVGCHIHPCVLLASIPDIEKFKGQYFHKAHEGCEKKTILTFGLGNLG